MTALNWVITSVLWFTTGYLLAKTQHHKYMSRGWAHLRDIARVRTITQRDEFDAFPLGSWWRL